MTQTDAIDNVIIYGEISDTGVIRNLGVILHV